VNAQMLQLAGPVRWWIVLGFLLRGILLAFAPAASLAEAAARDVVWWIVGSSRATRELSTRTLGFIPQVSSRRLVLAPAVLSGMLAHAGSLASLGVGAWLAAYSNQIQAAVDKRPSKLRAWASRCRSRPFSRS
jgi:hypothetical protein